MKSVVELNRLLLKFLLLFHVFVQEGYCGDKVIGTVNILQHIARLTI